jgi:hypothetical protein
MNARKAKSVMKAGHICQVVKAHLRLSFSKAKLRMLSSSKLPAMSFRDSSCRLLMEHSEAGSGLRLLQPSRVSFCSCDKVDMPLGMSVRPAQTC